MKRFLFTVMVACVCLSGCAAPEAANTFSPTELETETPQPSWIHAFTLTQTTPKTPLPTSTATRTPTSTHTSTPSPPVKLAYTISIVSPFKRTLHVHLEITDLYDPILILTYWTYAGNWNADWLNPLNSTTNIEATTSDGDPLAVSIVEDGIEWTGEGIQINALGNNHIILDYEVNVGIVDQNFSGDHPILIAGYMNDWFTLVESEFLLLVPADVEDRAYQMELRIDYPENQLSIAPWEEIGTHFYQINAQNMEFSYGVIAFGQIMTREQEIGDTVVRTGAYGFSRSGFDLVADSTFRIFRYFEEEFGSSRTPFYTFFFVPDLIDYRYLMSFDVQQGGYFTQYMNRYRSFWSDNVANPIAHNWIGGGFHGEHWFQEGFSDYYGLKACEDIGFYSHAIVQEELIARYSQYKTEIIGSVYDIPLGNAALLYSPDHEVQYNMLVKVKGSLFAYSLDLMISELTAGERSLDDLVALLYSKYYNSPTYVDVGQILEAAEQATGLDLSDFFEEYVRKNTPLPLEIQQGGLNLKEDYLP
ncbi:MAG: hypothetical protein MUO76_21225 [Anaerolineaceae bacterium]|nr:hypothetical protein [Anaerolineaceae bacterium]